MELKKSVALGKWRDPSEEEGIYGEAATPLGEVVLMRSPSSRGDVVSAAERHERWVLTLSGGHVMEIDDFGAPGVISRKILERGTSGSLNGDHFKINVSSSWCRARRCVSMHGLGIAFTPNGLGVELRENGERVALKRLGDWDVDGASAGAVLGLCLFEWAEITFFLRTPFVRLL